MKTVSLELSKQLEEKGYPQKSTYWFVDTRKSWKNYNQKNGVFIPFSNLVEGDPDLEFGTDTDGNKGYNNSKPLASPTADEILDLLPLEFLVKRKNDMWFIGSYDEDLRTIHLFTKAETISDAAAKMWLYLKENNML